ncbi:hypothetical protein AWL63_06195 [Sphingomonas panacis]|uniref:Uncharacterized protein n=1 Tax=Sphingomonas panacis TaxID=1560345 RepID=A0A1B3Z869_9SPHN|nr:hypothetical protein [Sphingomonas panacis]AOH83622.1 hypothetical protein AWL63_06195 [Sphingomonas panacis]
MAKISNLDPVQNPDGNETVVVLKNGVAQRTSIKQIIAPTIAALQDRVFAPKFTAFAASRNPVEYGDTGAINLNWSVSDAPASQKLNGAAIGAGDRSAVLAAPGPGWTADNVIQTVALFNGSGTQTDARTISIMARIPIFVGISPTATPDNTTLIGAAYKALDSDHIARSLTLARASGGFPFVLVPTTRPLSTIKLSGFAVSGWAPSDKAVALVTGQTVGMKLVILDAVAASATPLAVELS